MKYFYTKITWYRTYPRVDVGRIEMPTCRETRALADFTFVCSVQLVVGRLVGCWVIWLIANIQRLVGW